MEQVASKITNGEAARVGSWKQEGYTFTVCSDGRVLRRYGSDRDVFHGMIKKGVDLKALVLRHENGQLG